MSFLTPSEATFKLSPKAGAVAIGGTISGGTDTRVLFNDGGNLGEDAGFTYNKTTDILTLLGGCTITQTAASSGTPTAMILATGGAHTSLTASTEAIDINCNLARTVQFATGALATQRGFVVQAPTYAFVAASTITTAATFAITGAPTAGTNATITNNFSLWVQAGVTALIGGVTTAASSGDLGENFGAGSSSNTDRSSAFGQNASAGVQSVALGFQASAASTSRIAIGAFATATADNQFIGGSSNNPSTDVYIGSGVTSTTASSTTYNASGGSGTNIAGGNITIAGGKGTGNAAGGAVAFSTSDAGGSGTTLQSLTEKARFTVGGNLCIGVTTAGTSALKVLCLSNAATAAADSTDRAQLWCEDLSAGNATLAMFVETAVVTETVISDRTLSVRINGATYKICLKV